MMVITSMKVAGVHAKLQGVFALPDVAQGDNSCSALRRWVADLPAGNAESPRPDAGNRRRRPAFRVIIGVRT